MTKTIKPVTNSNNMIGKVSMIVALVNSGVPLASIAIARDLTAQEREAVKVATA